MFLATMQFPPHLSNQTLKHQVTNVFLSWLLLSFLIIYILCQWVELTNVTVSVTINLVHT